MGIDITQLVSQDTFLAFISVDVLTETVKCNIVLPLYTFQKFPLKMFILSSLLFFYEYLGYQEKEE